jgi:glycosyltransferase involved in cell wall biosynthesis
MTDKTLEAIERIKIAFVITGLNAGGAEVTLLKLLERLDRKRFRPSVISLSKDGDLKPKFEALDLRVQSINLKNPFNLFSLIVCLRRIKPDLVHTWMYHADLLGGLAAYLAGVKTIAWCIRNSNLDQDKTKRSTRLVVKLCALLSRRLPKTIVSCSEVAAAIHENLGYDRSKTLIIPNGFDLEVFKPDPAARSKIRRALNIDDQTPLIGLIARLDPQKNHEGFIKAAGIVARSLDTARFALVGAGIDGDNKRLLEAIEEENLTGKTYLLGRREDIPEICAALDILSSSSSYGEAFPNVLGEAMACGTVCAATNVGDSARIIGDAGRIVEVGDMQGLSQALLELLSMSRDDRRALGERARRRIADNFEVGDMTKRYESFYEALLCAA